MLNLDLDPCLLVSLKDHIISCADRLSSVLGHRLAYTQAPNQTDRIQLLSVLHVLQITSEVETYRFTIYFCGLLKKCFI